MQLAMTDIGQVTDIESPQVRASTRKSQGLSPTQFVSAAPRAGLGLNGHQALVLYQFIEFSSERLRLPHQASATSAQLGK
jgi:hypothetical protein